MLNYKEYVYAVYSERSFSKAAQTLHTSQPWLSAKIREIEGKVGLALFDRSTTPVSLTEAGKIYIEQAERMMEIEEEMRQRFDDLKEDFSDTIHIGSSMFFCTYVLPKLLNSFQREHPEAGVTFAEGNTDDLTVRLLRGELDVLLEVEEITNKRIVSVPWETEEIALAVPARFQINRKLKKYCYSFDAFLKRHEKGCKKPAVPLETFAEEPFLLLSEKHDIHRRSLELCAHAGFTPNVKLRLTQMMTAYYLICEGQGVSFLRSTIPEYVTPTDSIVFYQIDDPLAVRNIYLSYIKKKTSPIRQAFIRYLERLSKLSSAPV